MEFPTVQQNIVKKSEVSVHNAQRQSEIKTIGSDRNSSKRQGNIFKARRGEATNLHQRHAQTLNGKKGSKTQVQEEDADDLDEEFRKMEAAYPTSHTPGVIPDNWPKSQACGSDPKYNWEIHFGPCTSEQLRQAIDRVNKRLEGLDGSEEDSHYDSDGDKLAGWDDMDDLDDNF